MLEAKEPKIENNKALAKYHYLLGYYQSQNNHNFPEAVLHYTKAKNYHLKLKDSTQVAQTLLNIGVIQKDQNDFFGSKETLVEGLRYMKDSTMIAQCYNSLGTNHRKLLNYEEAIESYLQAVTISNSKMDKLVFTNNLATTYIDISNFKKAYQLLESIVDDSLLRTNKRQYARVLDNLAYTQWLNGEKVKKENFVTPLKIRRNLKDYRGQIASYTHLAEFFKKQNPSQTKIYLDSVIHLSKRLRIPRAEIDALQMLLDLEPTNIALKNRYIQLQDSIYAQELKVKTQFAKYIYDDKQKQGSILRLEKAHAEQELQTIKFKNQRIIAVATLIVLLVFSMFASYFIIQRNKRLKQESKNAQLRAIYETEASLSKKMHDDFGSKLNHAMIMLQNNHQSNDVLDVIGGLYDQSRKFSRKINDVDTGPNFKESLFGMMGTYCQDAQLLVTGSKEIEWNSLSELTKRTIYKVLQELMINMQKHSNASLVGLQFKIKNKNLLIEYIDDGVGASKKDLLKKNGLLITEKRILSIGGSITFESNKGEGFKALIEIPR
ncbi:tetratricopeptide repeat-containing sensor histidine kinase [Euzebyella saccharophila]|uniref:Tetratricopeptide repeat protein n=1 Tax=Euzebyella saccharophila TaxID=679664 RepID=A0ABV8JML6_9FLAO